METREKYLELLRNNFLAFIIRFFFELNPRTKYLPNWHIEIIAHYLELCLLGKSKRLIINLPPRSLKSFIASVALPAFILGHNPSAQIICVSYGQDLSDKWARDCLSLIQSSLYQELFPATRLSSRRQAIHDFSTTQNGFRLATSVGGPLTGRGADIIIIDDPCKPDEALSETLRKGVNEWYSHTLISRLNNKTDGCIILIMQRLHEDDLTGHVLQQEDWQVLKFPAIAEEDETFEIETPDGKRSFRRLIGEALHPERESLETLQKILQIQGAYHFAAQYQQRPAPLGGGMIKLAWFKTCPDHEWPKEFERIFQSWDTANKSSELNNFSVCTTWGVYEGHLYLLNVFRKRLNYPELKRAVYEQKELFDPETILIEDKASGTQLIQELLDANIYEVRRCESTKDKIMRAHSATSMLENGFVYIPEKAPWLEEFLHEVACFPKGKFDDQVDSMSQGLDWFKEDGRYMGGIFEYYRQEYEKLKKQKPSPFPDFDR